MDRRAALHLCRHQPCQPCHVPGVPHTGRAAHKRPVLIHMHAPLSAAYAATAEPAATAAQSAGAATQSAGAATQSAGAATQSAGAAACALVLRHLKCSCRSNCECRATHCNDVSGECLYLKVLTGRLLRTWIEHLVSYVPLTLRITIKPYA